MFKFTYSIFVALLLFSLVKIAFGQGIDETSSMENMENMVNIPQIISNFLNQFFANFFRGTTVWDLTAYTAGMALYSFFVWKFYRFVSRREIIPINLEKYSSEGKRSHLKIIAYAFSYVLLFPFCLFLWFFVYSFLIYFLARDIPTGTVLLISITVIVAIRITAYYQEDLARDLGKLLPFALLAVFLTSSAFFDDTRNFFSLADVTERFSEIPLLSTEIFKFILYAVFVETFLRIAFIIKRKIIPAKES